MDPNPEVSAAKAMFPMNCGIDKQSILAKAAVNRNNEVLCILYILLHFLYTKHQYNYAESVLGYKKIPARS